MGRARYASFGTEWVSSRGDTLCFPDSLAGGQGPRPGLYIGSGFRIVLVSPHMAWQIEQESWRPRIVLVSPPTTWKYEQKSWWRRMGFAFSHMARNTERRDRQLAGPGIPRFAAFGIRMDERGSSSPPRLVRGRRSRPSSGAPSRPGSPHARAIGSGSPPGSSGLSTHLVSRPVPPDPSLRQACWSGPPPCQIRPPVGSANWSIQPAPQSLQLVSTSNSSVPPARQYRQLVRSAPTGARSTTSSAHFSPNI